MNHHNLCTSNSNKNLVFHKVTHLINKTNINMKYKIKNNSQLYSESNNYVYKSYIRRH